MNNSTGPVQSIDRVFDIIETLAFSPSGMIISEIAEKCNLHISTTHRLLKALISRGYVRKDRISGKYALTMHLFEVGCYVSGSMDLLTISRPYLDELSDYSKEAVHLVQRDGSDVVYIYKSMPLQLLIRMASYVGGRNPMFCTGVGKSILAYLPDDEVKNIWRSSDIRQITKNTITDFETLKDQLLQSKQKGYATDNEENEEGVFCIAAPIFNWQGYPVAAASISAPIERMSVSNQERLIPKLLQVTCDISTQLGYVNRFRIQ